MAPQPENMKLTLLPFQRESLSWMQKQERGAWRGGILAVRISLGFRLDSDHLISQDEMGYVNDFIIGILLIRCLVVWAKPFR